MKKHGNIKKKKKLGQKKWKVVNAPKQSVGENCTKLQGIWGFVHLRPIKIIKTHWEFVKFAAGKVQGQNPAVNSNLKQYFYDGSFNTGSTAWWETIVR